MNDENDHLTVLDKRRVNKIEKSDTSVSQKNNTKILPDKRKDRERRSKQIKVSKYKH